MVTTELNEHQIQYAAQAPKMFEYIVDKFGWTDAQVSTVNWRGLGQAKNRLDRYCSIRTSKWIYEWLNVGSQKIKMGQDSTYPCCGTCNEDQLHLFRCEHPDMVETFNRSIRKLKLRLVKDGITTPIFTAYTNMICKVAGKPLSKESYCTDVQDVVEAQETLGMEAIIRGIHHVDWAHLLQKTWVPPAILPSGNRERQKDPLKQSLSFIRGIWDIFEEIWACRNGILHSKHSKLLERTDFSATSRLMEFRHDYYNIMLRSCDRFIISHHSPADVIRWPMTWKKAVLAQLEKLLSLYVEELKLEAAGYRDIRSYFVKLTGSVREENV
jgi:hypothetical protein